MPRLRASPVAEPMVGKADAGISKGLEMSIFANYIKSLTILALLAGGLSACSATGAPNLGAYNQVDRLVQVGCNDRIGGKN